MAKIEIKNVEQQRIKLFEIFYRFEKITLFH